MPNVTQILDSIEQGDARAAEELLPLVYQELRRLANHKMAAERPGQTLQPTALVHEAWLRLAGSNQQHYQNRRHFFGAAAEAMRRILVDNSRRKNRLKHGAGQDKIDIASIDIPIAQDDRKCLQVHEFLERLTESDPEKAEIVKLRVFTGMQVKEIAQALDC